MSEKYCDERCPYFLEWGDDQTTVICIFMEAEVEPFFCHEWEKAEMIHNLIHIEA